MGIARPLVYGKFTLRPGRDADIEITAEPETVEEFRKAVGNL